jgi:hypothetical protein
MKYRIPEPVMTISGFADNNFFIRQQKKYTVYILSHMWHHVAGLDKIKHR